MTRTRRPLDTTNSDFSLFDQEEAMIAEGEQMIRKLEEVSDGVRSLMRAYRQGYREQRRLVRLSDRMQDELRRLNQRLEAEVRAREALTRRLEALAAVDELTGAATRRHFMEVAGTLSQRWQQDGISSGVMMADIDQFKTINDRFGHAAGDEALRLFVGRLSEALRETDVVGRLGGEEFAVLLPDIDAGELDQIAERLRSTIAAIRLPWKEDEIRLTASFGVARFSAPGDDIDRVLSRADKALYAAKRAGRNRVATSDAGGGDGEGDSAGI
ncbi:GGDEF domain-containing protein [Tistrella bauzanensis]|uniref:diguanylate cyclase n=1 Tax=Tistrella arctica TaxID=3133430 RepID=A0ABU9YRQ4_9PROT